MEKQTVFVKRYPSKGELPEKGKFVFFVTKYGTIKVGFLSVDNDFISSTFKDPLSDIDYWLEEIELPSEEEIDVNLFEYLFEQDSRANYALYQEGYKDGINFILNKLK